MEAVIFTVLACVLVGVFICMLTSVKTMYNKEVVELLCISAVAGAILTVLVYLIALEVLG